MANFRFFLLNELTIVNIMKLKPFIYIKTLGMWADNHYIV